MMVDVAVEVVVVVKAISVAASVAFAACMFERIVSSSSSTFLFGPRSHCRDLRRNESES
jgi:hypothetical protein